MSDRFYVMTTRPLSKNIDLFIEVKKQSARPQTIQSYFFVLKNYYDIVGTDLVTDETLQIFLEAKSGNCDGSINQYLTVLKNYARWLSRRRIIEDDNFLKDYKLIKNPELIRERKKYSEEEVKEFLDVKPRWLHYFMFIGFYFGLRINEIARLKYTDICLEEQYLDLRPEVQKIRKQDYIAIPDLFYDKFAEMLNWRMGLISDNSFLLINQQGNQVRIQTLRNHLLKTLRKIDPDFRFHHMRYTSACRAYEQTQDIYAAQRMLRHSSPTETVKYLKVQKEQMLSHQREQMSVIYGNVSL